jgi:hypothetical protein
MLFPTSPIHASDSSYQTVPVEAEGPFFGRIRSFKFCSWD